MNHGNITPGSPEKHPFELILASGGTFSGLNHLLGGVKTSDMVQSGQDTSPDVVEGSRGVQKQYITVISHSGCPEKHDFGRIWASGGTFSGLSHLVGGVKTSYLVQRGQDTSPDVVKGREGPRSHISRQYHVRMSRKTPFRAHLGLWRPPEASGGQTRQTIVGTKVAWGMLEVFGSS